MDSALVHALEAVAPVEGEHAPRARYRPGPPYQGEVDNDFSQVENVLRVSWER